MHIANQPNYYAGRAMFFRGHVPCGAHTAQELCDKYEALSNTDKHIADGWFDARDDVRLHFMGTKRPSTRPMPMAVKPAVVRADNDDTPRRGMSKAFRRKGRNAIIMRWNAEGTSIAWQGMTHMLDNFSVDERTTLINNIAERQLAAA